MSALGIVLMLAWPLLFIVPPASGDVPVRTGVRVASYNINAGVGVDGKFDLARTVAALRGLNADVIGLQEVDVHWGERSGWRDVAGELAGALGMRSYFAPIYDLDPPAAGKPRRQFGTAVLSRYPIFESFNHSLTRVSAVDPGAGPVSVPGFAEVGIRVGGTPVHVYSTVLDTQSDAAVRRRQVEETLKVLGEDGGHQVLVGSFNAGPGASELAPLWGSLTDAWAAAGGGSEGLTYPAQTPDRRIDYVATSRQTAALTAQVPNVSGSDHLPTIADLQVMEGAQVP
ncbi:endonuclease/exonuclease/phosphatase family protein [Actinomadura fibrosa]|uniref:Endonuclease/exonuclease/phosphatase family protein n=1 Tax=Actinomadura fibrosa TaxID=111802 RepID=A0ABW2XM45_9ACTN|nr:endonuclease/exonuclease/phosphatase family protein [Actinomadura fibrosa]